MSDFVTDIKNIVWLVEQMKAVDPRRPVDPDLLDAKLRLLHSVAPNHAAHGSAREGTGREPAPGRPAHATMGRNKG